MIKTCEKCGGLIADNPENYNIDLGCECPINQGESSESYDEEPEECIY